MFLYVTYILLKVSISCEVVGDYVLFLCRHLSSEWEATRIEALHWISALLEKHRGEVPLEILYLELYTEICLLFFDFIVVPKHIGVSDIISFL